MKRLRTVRARFALWTAGLFLVALSAFGAYVYGAMARGLTAALDESLALAASQVVAGLEIAGGRLVLTEDIAAEPDYAGMRERGLTVRILAPDGQALQEFGPYRALPVPPDGPDSAPVFTTLTDSTAGTSVRVYTASVEAQDRRVALVQVAQSLAGVQDTLQRLRAALLVSVPLLVAVCGLGGYLLAARALAPIDRITRTARGIAAGEENLSARLGLPPADDEVGRLAATFDAMLARLDDAFRRERQFTADASHELRTPLAAIQAILSLVREQRRAPAEYEQALADLAAQTGRLRALTDDLLRLARAEAGRGGPVETIDLSALVRDVADSMRPLAEAKGLALDCSVPDGLTTFGDRDDLIRMLANVLHNAVKYTAQGGLSVSAGRDGEHGLCVEVGDTGPGIAAEHLPHIFDRFYRVDGSRTIRGAGLGLAIAAEIARAHGGRIDVRSAVGQGTSFVIILPGELQAGDNGANT